MKALFIALVLLFSVTAQAQSWLSGETSNKAEAFAGTSNDSGGVLAQYCAYGENFCYWSLSSDSTTCKAEESYPALVNSDAGAVHAFMYCYKDGDKNRMAFKDFDEIDRAVRGSKNIAIVVPMASGNFRVSRFNLAGALPVLNSMRDAAQKKAKTSTKDLNL